MSSTSNFQEEDFSCRICLEPSTRGEVIAPCSCKGSSKWVHRVCLDRWRTTREDKAFSKCTECLQCYTLIARVDDSYRPKLMRRAKFFFLVLRDISIAFLLLQLIILGLSSLVYVSDEESHFLLKYFKSDGHIRLFYYCSGLIIFLSIVGMLYFCGISSNNMASRCNNSCQSRNSSYVPFYYYDTPGYICMDCGGRNTEHG